MKVYLAAPYGAREYVKTCADELSRIGFMVTSSWLDETHEINDGTEGPAAALGDDEARDHALTDLADVAQSKVLVLFTPAAVGDIRSGGGRHIETGYALAHGIDVVVVGEPESIFHRLNRIPASNASVTVVADWHEAVLELSARLVALIAAMPMPMEG